MSGNIFGHEDTEITLFKIRFFQYGFQSMIGINFPAYSDRGFNPLLFGMLSRTIFMKKPVFHFWRQIQISTEISQNYANISGHWSNFETKGGRVHAPGISLQLPKNRLPISRETAPQ